MGRLKLNRLHGFLLVSAGLIVAGVVVCGLVVGWVLERQVLAEERAHTTMVVLGQARLRLTPRDFERAAAGAKRDSLEAFLQGLPHVFRIKVFDKTGTIVWSNEGRLIGERFPDNLYVAKALQGEVAMVLERPKRPEHVYERSAGYVAESYIPIALSGSPGIVGVVETYADVTETIQGIRRAQRLIWAGAAGVGVLIYMALAFVVWRARVSELEALRRLEAEQRMAALGRLAAGVAHELKTPLTILMGRIALLKAAQGPDLPSRLASLDEAADRIARIVQSLSVYSKPPRPEPTLLNLTELLRTIQDLVASPARASRVTTVLDAPASLPAVRGDRSQLMQILVNLATNALEAMAKAGGRLTLKAELQHGGTREQGTVRVEVSDTGPGIPPEAFSKIWEAFYTTKPEGTGLGLSIVRGLVAEQPGATIAVESTPGRGTTFILAFPVANGRE